jgi:serine/threonine-protein kinase RsbW
MTAGPRNSLTKLWLVVAPLAGPLRNEGKQMAASTPCGHTPAQSASRVPATATGQAAAHASEGSREAGAGGQPLPSPVNIQHGGWWERAFPGTRNQIRLLRASLAPLLTDCPMADDVILLMSELGANAVRHSDSGRDGGTFTARLVDLPGEYVLGVVEDGGSDWDGDFPHSARNASGLHLLLALSADCGVYGGRRKRAVWFRMQYPPTGSAQPDAPGALPVRAPGEQGPTFPVPLQNPRAAVDPEVMERVRVALVRL